MGVRDRIKERNERIDLRDELIAVFQANPELAKTAKGRDKAMQSVLSRRKLSAGGAKAIDPDKIARWLEILKAWLPFILKLFT